MTGKNFRIEAEVVNGKCPTCDEFTMLVGLTVFQKWIWKVTILEMMTWTKPYLESLNILQLRELKEHVDTILERKIKQSKRIPDERVAERNRP